MLMMVPRLSVPTVQLRSGTAADFAMLGLGDIVLPGLLLTLARRLDLSIAHHRAPSGVAASHGCGGGGYWITCALGYTVGLAITLMANIYGWTFNGVQGQPALLYLVPCTVGAVSLVALCRGELSPVWHGALLLQPAESRAASPRMAADAETQPFSPCCCDEYYEYDANYDPPQEAEQHKQL